MKLKVHFTVSKVLTTFCEEIESDTMDHDALKKILTERIALADLKVDNQLVQVRDIFYIEAMQGEQSNNG